MKCKQVLIAIDQVLNTLVGGFADETLSARAWRCRHDSRRWSIARRVIDTVFFFDTDHCEQAYLNEFDRRHFPTHYRGNDANT